MLPMMSSSRLLANHTARLSWSPSLMYFSMGPMIGLPLPGFVSGEAHAFALALVQLLLTLPILIVNRKYFINGFRTLWHRAPTMDALIGKLEANVSVVKVETSTDGESYTIYFSDDTKATITNGSDGAAGKDAPVIGGVKTALDYAEEQIVMLWKSQ